MKLLLYSWGAYLQQDIKQILTDSTIEYREFQWVFEDRNNDEKLEKWFKDNIDASSFDAILSVNYWPVLSKIANDNNIKYIAWCYDNPFDLIDVEATLGNPCNYVFLFDRIQMEGYKKQGFDTVYHLPLGVNEKRLANIQITDADRKKYTADVSLVGSLYESEYQNIVNVLDDKSKGFVDAVMLSQQQIYGAFLVDKVITSEFIDEVNKKIKESHPKTKFVLPREALIWAMASELTRKDRLSLLALLGKRCDTHLYSFHNMDGILKDVKCSGAIDYVTEMPKVFALSKVNLNPMLRIIQSGVSLRAFDIMGCGGLLLSSYQPELAELFVDGQEMVMYSSIEDAIAKTEFLLQNEDVRERIAQAGRKKVLTNFTLSQRFKEICRICTLRRFS